MKKILFVCTGNTCRSPMAEGIFNSLAKEYHVDAVAESAGFDTEDGLPASENAIKACSEIGVDISNHKSKKFDECNLDEYIKFLTMSFDHANILIDKGIPWSKIEVLCGADHGVPDPYGFGLGIYRSCRDVIKRCIEKYFIKLEEKEKDSEIENEDNRNEWG